MIKYQPGEKYNPHMDPHDNAESGPQESKRVATVVVYLNDVGSGGETLFPREGRDGEQHQHRVCRRAVLAQCRRSSPSFAQSKGGGQPFFAFACVYVCNIFVLPI